jgi:peptide/nickel transport system ATP-binding protein
MAAEDDATELEPVELIPAADGSSRRLPFDPDAPLLEVEHLTVEFPTDDGLVHAVDDVSFSVRANEVLGIVGESGSGKSVTSMAILGLLPKTANVRGSVRFRGVDLIGRKEKEMQPIRGARIAMIFQDALASLNPVFKVGDQIDEAIRVHRKLPNRAIRERVIELLDLVGIPQPRRRADQYPHEYSGGMRQRAMIAMSIANDPDILIADEPTTALDVTIQAQILDLMLELKGRQKDSAILLITHNLAVVAETCDRVAVMYGGKIQELAPVKELFRNPMHPYTRGLLGSLPRVDGDKAERLTTIPGSVPDILELPAGCKFTTRCPDRFEPCPDIEPALVEHAPGHFVRCHLYGITNDKDAAHS